MGTKPQPPARREIAAQLADHAWCADQREYTPAFIADELAKYEEAQETAASWPHRHCRCEICG